MIAGALARAFRRGFAGNRRGGLSCHTCRWAADRGAGGPHRGHGASLLPDLDKCGFVPRPVAGFLSEAIAWTSAGSPAATGCGSIRSWASRLVPPGVGVLSFPVTTGGEGRGSRCDDGERGRGLEALTSPVDHTADLLGIGRRVRGGSGSGRTAADPARGPDSAAAPTSRGNADRLRLNVGFPVWRHRASTCGGVPEAAGLHYRKPPGKRAGSSTRYCSGGAAVLAGWVARPGVRHAQWHSRPASHEGAHGSWRKSSIARVTWSGVGSGGGRANPPSTATS